MFGGKKYSPFSPVGLLILAKVLEVLLLKEMFVEEPCPLCVLFGEMTVLLQQESLKVWWKYICVGGIAFAIKASEIKLHLHHPFILFYWCYLRSHWYSMSHNHFSWLKYAVGVVTWCL